MATKLKAMIPPGTVTQRPRRDDGQNLIRKSVRTSRRPKFSIRSKKSTQKKSTKCSKADHISSSNPPAWDAFEQADPASGETAKKSKKSKKKRISFKVRTIYRLHLILKLRPLIVETFERVALRTLESDPVADARGSCQLPFKKQFGALKLFLPLSTFKLKELCIYKNNTRDVFVRSRSAFFGKSKVFLFSQKQTRILFICRLLSSRVFSPSNWN